jgi:hypothetical protein
VANLLGVSLSRRTSSTVHPGRAQYLGPKGAGVLRTRLLTTEPHDWLQNRRVRNTLGASPCLGVNTRPGSGQSGLAHRLRIMGRSWPEARASRRILRMSSA